MYAVKAKFHYASWFEADSKLVADRFEAKFHHAIWMEAGRRPASNQLRTSSEPASVMEFGFNTVRHNAVANIQIFIHQQVVAKAKATKQSINIAKAKCQPVLTLS